MSYLSNFRQHHLCYCAIWAMFGSVIITVQYQYDLFCVVPFITGAGWRFRDQGMVMVLVHKKKKKLLREAGRCPPDAIPRWCNLFPCRMSFFWQCHLLRCSMSYFWQCYWLLCNMSYFWCCYLLLFNMSFLVMYYGALLQCRSNLRLCYWLLCHLMCASCD